jgi:histidyl-tRNA synthetase
MKSIIQAVKGTREFYPPEMEIRKWLYSKIQKVSELFGYQEYDGPFLEKIDLYAAKSGEELVKEQAFVFPDRGGDLITLRPELTPSLARMVAGKQNDLAFPIKWWSFGPFWRYEKPQRGRTREFFQWNIDLIGANSPEADAELVAVCALFLKSTGISSKEVYISVNHRSLMDVELEKIGISSEKKKFVFHLIDRRDKLPAAQWENFALENGINADQLTFLKTLLENKDLWKNSPELIRVFAALDSMGVSEYVKYDPNIIRGLDYYTGIVFEAWDASGDGRAVLGGGHYDNLVGDVGGQPLPGVGFAMGDVMITLLLQKYGKIPVSKYLSDCVLVTIFDESTMIESMKVASVLRENGIKTVCYPEAGKLGKQFKYADRILAPVCIVLGPDEIVKMEVTIKNLKDRTQITIPQKEMVDAVNRILA